MYLSDIRAGFLSWLQSKCTNETICADILPSSQSGGIAYLIHRIDYEDVIPGNQTLTKVVFEVDIGKLTRAATDLIVSQITTLSFRESTTDFQDIEIIEIADIPYDNESKFFGAVISVECTLRYADGKRPAQS